MASADGGVNVPVCGAWVDRGPLFYMATHLPTDPLVSILFLSELAEMREGMYKAVLLYPHVNVLIPGMVKK